MKIFVSHAIKDSKLIDDLKSSLEPHGLQLLIAEHHSDIHHSTITEKIEAMIESSNIALILLTSNGFNSNFVQQEIGYIKSSKIPYLQIVEGGIERKITGFNYGKGYIEYCPDSPQKAIEKIELRLLSELKLHKQKEQEQTLKELGLGLLAMILIWGMTNEQ